MRVSIETMLEEIKKKLQFVNAGVLQADNFSEERYDDLLEIFEMVRSKDSFTVREMEAIITELGKLRK